MVSGASKGLLAGDLRRHTEAERDFTVFLARVLRTMANLFRLRNVAVDSPPEDPHEEVPA